ncbi:TonB-dependent receptor [Chondrinema litorale]|uniref:TonB-dependent receptor n=1 Tax=Chondrinema litorale TaxID=2994555 RepID=UPI00254382E2|nr:TonB-dependent receptor [Chondrinema litorale]UZR94331.1 TonB-dependent receptor [Chondrinema litorale]
MIKYIQLTCLMLLSGYLLAQSQQQNYDIKGHIYDEGDHLLPGATVFIPELKEGVVSDIDGNFELKNIAPGEYIIVVRYLGFEPIERKVQVPSYESIDVHLQGEFHILNEVSVEEEKVTTGLQTVESVSIDELQKKSGGSLAESVSNITGVTMLQTGPAIAKPVIHGLHSNRVLIMNNGVRQEGQQWGTEHAPEIDPFTAQTLKVIKGAAAVRYGSDAVAGVLLVEPPELPTTKGLTGDVNLVGTSNGRQGIASVMLANGSQKMKGLGWRLQSSAKKAGDFHAPNYMLTNTGLHEINFSGEVGINREKWGGSMFYSLFTTETGILKSAHIGNLTDLQEAIERDEPFYIEDFSYEINNPKQDVAHQLAKVKGYYNFNDNSKLSLQVSQQVNSRKEYDIRRGDRDDTPALDLKLESLSGELVLEQIHTDRLKGTYGISFMDQKNRNIPGTGVRPLIPNYLSTSIGAFAIESYGVNKWEFELGARYDYRRLEVYKLDDDDELITPTYNFNNASVTGSVEYLINDNMQLTSNLATAFRPPSVSELYSEGLHHGVAAIEEGNPDLNSEKSFKWVNTFDYNKNPFAFSTSIYYQRIQDFIYLEPLAEYRLTIRGAFPVFVYKQTDARLMGLDAQFKYQINQSFGYLAKYSMVRARDISNDNYLINMPADRIENGLTYNKDLLGKLSDLFIELNTVYVAEQTRVPGIDYTTPPDAYFLTNIQAGFSYKIMNLDTDFSLSVNNAFNTAYRDYLNRFRYYADNMGRNFILRLHVNF